MSPRLDNLSHSIALPSDKPAAQEPTAALPPDDLAAQNDWLAGRPDATALCPIGTRRIVLAERALEQLGELLRELGRRGGCCLYAFLGWAPPALS